MFKAELSKMLEDQEAHSELFNVDWDEQRDFLRNSELSHYPPKDRDASAEYYEAGVIPMEKLEIGQWYIGICRNSCTALWDGTQFWYVRRKWPVFDPFKESIQCMERDDGYDLFLPFEKLEI